MACVRAFLLVTSVLVAAAKRDPNIVHITEAPSKDQAVTGHLQNPLLQLNRYTFGGNVLQRRGSKELVGHWIVSFCPTWWEPCQSLTPSFASTGHDWERKLNTALLTVEVRFATVDCATEKVLCNEQQVESYPTVQHYHDGKIVATFRGRGKHTDVEALSKWLTKQMPEPAANTPAPWVWPSLGRRALDLLRLLLLVGADGLYLLLPVGVLLKNSWAAFCNPRVREKVFIDHAGVVKPKIETRPAVDEAEPARQTLAQLLPEEWSTDRKGIEL